MSTGDQVEQDCRGYPSGRPIVQTLPNVPPSKALKVPPSRKPRHLSASIAALSLVLPMRLTDFQQDVASGVQAQCGGCRQGALDHVDVDT